MTIEEDVAALIVSVDTLIEAVNLKKAELDAAVAAAGGGIESAADVPGLLDLLALKAPLDGPTFSGTVTATAFVGDGSGLTGISGGGGSGIDEIDDVPGLTAALAAKAPLSAPTFTGTVTATAFVGDGSGLTGISGGGSVDGIEDVPGLVSALALLAPLDSPTFTGTVAGITAAMVGLPNVNNTSDANKPVSTAQQAALDLKLDTEDYVIVNDLTSSSTTSALSAAMGKSLKDQLDAAVIGGGGGVTEFSALSDVNLTSLTNLDLVRWDTSSSKFINASIATLGLETTTGAQAKVDALDSEVTTALNLKVDLSSIVDSLVSTADDAPLSAAQGKVLKDLIDGLDTSDIAGLTTALDGKSNVSDIVDTLVSTASDQPLSAAQGKALKDLIDALDTTDIAGLVSALAAKAPLSAPTFTGTVTATSFAGDGSALTGLPGSTVGAAYVKHSFTATAGQTVFTGNYGVGYCDVWRNGVKLGLADYTATDGTSVTLANACKVNDHVEVVGWGVTPFSVLSDVNLTSPSNDELMVYDTGFIVNKSIVTLGLETETGAQDKVDALEADIITLLAGKASLTGPTFSGTVTATAFVGDGSGLTGISGSGVDEIDDVPGLTSALAAKASSTNPVFSGSITEGYFTITDGPSVNLNTANGTLQKWVLGASRTATVTGIDAGQAMTLMVDDGDAYTLTLSGVTWVGGSPPVLASSGYTVIGLWNFGAVYGVHRGDVA